MAQAAEWPIRDAARAERSAGLGAGLSAALLTPLAWGYGALIRARNRAFDSGRLAIVRLPAPVISVGNLTVGGTGKTPFVMEIIRRLRACGARAAILTRGYGGSATTAADEVLEYQLALPDTPVIVDSNRAAGGRRALDGGADVLVLDDGFQHRRLARDLDIVLIDAMNPWGGGRLLPAGRLREPTSALRRAGLIVLTRCEAVDAARTDALAAEARRLQPAAPLLRAVTHAAAIATLSGERLDLEELAFERVLPVCAIGNPGGFLAMAHQLVGSAAPPLLWGDHHRYDRRDVARICDAARRQTADVVLTTRKDWVKLAPLWPADGEPELWRLDTRTALHDPDDELGRRLSELTEARDA